MLTDKEQEEIRRKLLGLEEEPPANGWSRIAADIQPPRQPRPVWWIIPVVLLLLLGSVGVYYLVEQPEKESTAIATNQDKNQPASAAASEQNKDDKVASADRPVLSTTEPGLPAKGVADQKTGTAGETNLKADGAAEEDEQDVIRNDAPGQRVSPKPEGSIRVPVIVGKKRPKIDYNPEEEEYKTSKETTTASTVKIETSINPAWASTGSNESIVSEYLVTITPELDGVNTVSVSDLVNLGLPADSTYLHRMAAEQEPDSSRKSEWYLGVLFAPRYTFRVFTPTASDDVYITRLNNYKKLDPKRMGYEFGINIGKNLKPNLFLETGLSLMQLHENVLYAFTTGQVDTLLKSRTSNGSYQATPVYVEGQRQLESTFTYGGFRVGVTYYFRENSRSRLNLTLAGGANLLLIGKTHEYIDGKLKETIDFPSENNVLEQTNYNLLVGAGYNMMLPKSYELMLMPSLNYFLGSTFNKREPFGLKPYTLGVQVQLRRRFIRN